MLSTVSFGRVLKTPTIYFVVLDLRTCDSNVCSQQSKNKDPSSKETNADLL